MKKGCEDYKILISQMLDGELDERERDNLFTHLTECDECKEEYDKFKQLNELISAYPKEKLSEEFSREFERKIPELISDKKVVERRIFRKTYWMIPAAAAILLILLVNITSVFKSDIDEGIPQLADVVGAIGDIDKQSPDGQWDDVTPYGIINNGDLIRTGKESNITLELTNKSEVRIEENSLVKIDKIPQRKIDYRLILEKGEVEAQVKNLVGKFVVETTYGQIEVLGTIFKAKFEGDKLRIRVDEGVVQFISPEEIFRIREGFILIYKPGEHETRRIEDIEEEIKPVIAVDIDSTEGEVKEAEPKDYTNILVFNDIPVYFPRDNFDFTKVKLDLSDFGYREANEKDLELIYNKSFDTQLEANINKAGLKFYINERNRFIIITVRNCHTLRDRIDWWNRVKPIEKPIRSVKEDGYDFGFWAFSSFGNVNLHCYTGNWIYSITLEKDPESPQKDDKFYQEKLRDNILKLIVEKVQN